MRKQACIRNGFTLVEMMVVIAVAALLLSMAVPSFQGTLQSNRMAANVNELVSALHLARSEAIKRGLPVTICKGTATACNNAAQWEAGWIVFADDIVNTGQFDVGNGTCAPPDDCVLRVYPALDPGFNLGGNNTAANRVTYDSKGFAPSVAANGDALIMCDDRGFVAQARAVLIARTGRAQTVSATASGLPGCI